VDLDPRRVLDWSFVSGNDGALQLAWAVIREDVETEAEPFRGRKTEHRYRLWRPESWELWRKDDSGKAQLVEEGRNTLGEIPLTAFYSDYAGPFTGRSVLAGVVSLCLAHYRKWSDRDNSEFWAGMPTWVFKNWPEDSEIVIGSGNGIVTPTRDSEVQIIEHSGAAIESMRQTETDIISAIYEIAMRQVRRTTRQVESAESKRMDRANMTSVLQDRARRFASSELRCWSLAARWMGLRDPELSVEYNRNMDPEGMGRELLESVLDLRRLGDLSRDTLWRLLRREEILGAEFDPEEEAALLENEQRQRPGPSLAGDLGLLGR